MKHEIQDNWGSLLYCKFKGESSSCTCSASISLVTSHKMSGVIGSSWPDCVISDFCCDGNEIFTFLGHYAAWISR